MRSASGASRRLAEEAAMGDVSKRDIGEVLGSRSEVRGKGALAGGFVEEERAGNSSIETFDGARHGDGDACVGNLKKFWR
jgi:hypothetical protein